MSTPSELSRNGLKALVRELRIAMRMMPRMYWVPMRGALREIAQRLGH